MDKPLAWQENTTKEIIEVLEKELFMIDLSMEHHSVLPHGTMGDNLNEIMSMSERKKVVEDNLGFLKKKLLNIQNEINTPRTGTV